MAITNKDINPDEIEEQLKNFEVEEEEVKKNVEETPNEENVDVEELNKKLDLIEKEEKEAIKSLKKEKEMEEEPEEEETSEEETKKEETKEEVKKEEKKEEKEEEKKEEIDYKARYIGSSQEARVLLERNKLYQEAMKKAEEIKDVSNEELIKEYGEEKYTEADDDELKIMKERLIAKKKLEIVNEALKKDQEVEKWLMQVRDFIKSDEIKTKYPELEEHKDDFVRFTAMPSRVGLDLEMLAKTFLFDKRKVPHTGNVLLGKSSKVKVEKKTTITPKEAEYLRKTNFRLYKQMVVQGRINIDV